MYLFNSRVGVIFRSVRPGREAEIHRVAAEFFAGTQQVNHVIHHRPHFAVCSTGYLLLSFGFF